MPPTTTPMPERLEVLGHSKWIGHAPNGRSWEVAFSVAGGTIDLERAFADEIARRYNAYPALVEALRPFAAFACDEPHVGEPECHNCIARAVPKDARLGS